MKKISLPLLIITTFLSCKKQVEKPSTNDNNLPDFPISVVGPKSLNSLPNNKIDKVYYQLGYGYDITGKYADTSAVRAKAINVAAYANVYPNRFDLSRNTVSTFNTINAVNAEDFAKQTSSQLQESQGLNLCKGTILTAFPNSNAFSAKYVYGSYSNIIQWKRVKFVQNYDLLKNFLTPDFNADVQNLPVSDLVKKYGTHVLSDIILGAKFTVIYQAETSVADRLAKESASFTYVLSKVFGLTSGKLDAINLADLKAVSSPRVVYEAVGADLSKLVENRSGKTPTLDINNWHLSSKEADAEMIDIWSQGLIPLYELIGDSAKKAAVKNYITTYLLTEQVKVTN